MIIHDGNEMPIMEGAQDPDEARYYTFQLRPDVWQPGVLYYDNDIVIPAEFNGYYYVVLNGGKSGPLEPGFGCRSGEKVDDGCITWLAVPYDLYLRPGVNIDTADWSADVGGVSITNVMTTDDKTTALIADIPADADSVRITIRFAFSGTAERCDRSFVIPVSEL